MLYSSDEIWRGSNEERCLTDDLNDIESNIADLETDKADADHTHDGYAPADHSHTGFAASGHSHSEYAPVSHEHTGYASDDHSHSPASIGAAPAVHSHDYAAPTHSHVQSDISGLEAALSAKAPNSALSAKADLVDGKVPASQLPGFVDDVTEYANLAAFPANGESGKIYVAQDTNKTYRWSGTGYIEISASLALGETSSTAFRGDLGKTAYNHSQNGTVHVTAAQKTAWDGKAAGNHTHAYGDLTGLPTFPTSLPANGGNADTVDGKHAADFMAKALQFTSDLGGMEKTFYTEDNTNLISELEALSMGFHTVYSQGGVPGNPNTAESWRCFLHKPSSNIMWVLAFGTSGSIYSNYWNGGNWRGWRKFYSTGDAPTAAEVGAAAADHSHMVFNSATSATTYKLIYVGPNGNDNNTGYSTSVPMATIKGVIRKYAAKHKMLDIRLLDGTYTENIGAIGTDVANLSIRSVSENKDAVTINMSSQMDLNSGLVRMYNMTLNVTATGNRAISLNAGALYMYGVRINLPTASTSSCVNVYNGTQAFLMNCVLNAGTGSSAGAAIYGNQALLVKAINCTSERKNAVGVHAHNGSDIWYTDTINATTKAKETSWGKCTVR